MSNNGLETTGLRYIIDDSSVQRSASNILGAQARIDASTRGLTQRVDQFDLSLVQLNVNSRQVQSVLTSLALATGPLEIGLGLVAGGFIAGKVAVDAASQSFEAHQQQVANVTRSYGELYKTRLTALTTPEGFIGEFLPSFKDAIYNGILKSITDVLNSPFQLSTGGLAQNLGGNILTSFFADQQAKATANQIQGAQSRINAANLRAEIAQMQLQGKSYDELTVKAYAYLNAQRAVGRAEGSGVGGQIVGRDVENFLRNTFPQQALSDRASKLGQDILNAQQQYQQASQAALAQHNARMVEIDLQGALRRADIQRGLERRLSDIDESVAERLADAEERTNERRLDLAQTLNERRLDIESRYQDDVRRVKEDADASIFEAAVNRDGFALLRAKKARERGLQDAEVARNKDLSAAAKDYDEGNRKLTESLNKERVTLQRNAQRERNDAREAAAEQLADLQRSQAQQKQAEARSYAERQAQLRAAYAERKSELIRALAEEKGLTEDYAKAIITSLKGILSPDEINKAIKNFQDALSAQVNITVTPLAKPNTGGGISAGKQAMGPQGFAYGGYDAFGGGRTDPGEWIVPNPSVVGTQRTLDVFGAMLNRTITPILPMMGRMAGGGRGADSTVRVEVLLNEGMLEARIVNGATNVAAEVIKPRGYGRR